MKRIKEIISALNTLDIDAPKAIRHSMDTIRRLLSETELSDYESRSLSLVTRIVYAVVGIAEDMEKPAKGEEAKT